MRKRALLSLMLAVALILTSACSLIIKDPEVDKETVIIEVGGQNITKQEVQAQIEAVHSQQAQIYSQYGISYDPTSEYSIESAREQAIEALIEHTVEEQKIAAYGFDVYTDEELAQAQEDAQADWDTNFEWVKLMSFSSTELTGDELTEAVEAKMTEEGYPTLEQLVDLSEEEFEQRLLDAMVVEQAVGRLPPLQREAIVLHYFDGFTPAEIARMTGTPLSTVRWRLNTARHTLAQWLKEEEHG